MSRIMWQPGRDRVTQSHLFQFMALVKRHYDIEAFDYATLHRWSCEHSAEFWRMVLEFCAIRYQGNPQPIVDQPERFPGAHWFPGLSLNFAENLLAPALDASTSEKPALVFHSEDGQRSSITYRKLRDQALRLARFMANKGVTKGDRVVAVMPNCIETVVGMLATVSLGAVWSSCSPDFGVQGIVERFQQIEPVMLIAANGYRYGGKPIYILDRVAQVQRQIPSIRNVVVVNVLPEQGVQGKSGRPGNPGERSEQVAFAQADLYHQVMAGNQAQRLEGDQLEFVPVEFNHPLYIMYSSGTTGVPKCIVHSTGGTLLQHRKEHSLHSDLKRSDVFFFFTTCGWMMWNWLISGLASAATLVLFDGSPFFPSADRLLDLVDEEKISLFGISAKYLAALEKAGVQPVKTHRLSSLRTIFSTGSPLVHESFDYVYRDIKQDLCLASISGGTDIISCFALGNPVLPVIQGEIQCLGLGMDVKIVNDHGESVVGTKGELICANNFPSCPLGFWNDPNDITFKDAYFSRFNSMWAHGDYGEITPNGGMIIYGRADAVLNPGGVRIGTAEIYRQVEKLDFILESVAVGQIWQGDIRVILFVRLKDSAVLGESWRELINSTIRNNTTPRHVPAKIIPVDDIPRTISGKIAELAVRRVIHGESVPNTDALANPESLELFKGLKELQV